MRCRKCKADSMGSLCPNCEKDFKLKLRLKVGINYNFNIGDSLYILKALTINKHRKYEPVKVIFKGPNSWVISHWAKEGDSYLIDRFTRSTYQSVFECSEIGKKNVLNRRIDEFYKTRELCLKANESFLKKLIVNSKREAIFNLVNDKLDETLSETTNIEDFDANAFLLPILDEIELRNKLYKQIREDIKSDIIENERDAIKNEIITEIYKSIEADYMKSKSKFLNTTIKSLTHKFTEDLENALDKFINNL